MKQATSILLLYPGFLFSLYLTLKIGTTRSCEMSVDLGRAIAQAVSHRLPTAAARVQTRVWSCGIL
jgi:hypothetical protein